MNPCPSQSQLLEFVEGTLSQDDSQSLDTHISDCDLCQESLERLTGLTLPSEPPHTSLARQRMEKLPPSVADRLVRDVAEVAGIPAEPVIERSDFEPIGPAHASKARGHRLGDYEIIHEIGRGGMGVVYEARQLSLGRTVALKVLPQQLFGSRTGAERFRREARAASQLHHTNIVPVFEVGEDQGTLYYSMQRIDGIGLDSWIAPQPPQAGVSTDQNDSKTQPLNQCQSSNESGNGSEPPPIDNPVERKSVDNASAEKHSPACHRAIAEIGLQIASALAHAHDRGIIHRDVKPSNLLLDSEGVAWLADFGLAKQTDDGLTGTMEAPGTLRYMSPERFVGQCDSRSDIYALGVTLYELLAKRPAFSSTDHLSLMQQIQTTEPRRLRDIDATIPRDLQTIVAKAMHKEPMRRYATAAELGVDLRRFLQGDPIRARAVGRMERLWLWAKKQPALAASLAMVLLLLVGSLIGALYAASTQSRLVTEKTKLAAEKAAESAEANRQRDVAKLNAYYSDIRQAHRDWLKGDVFRMQQALKRHLPSDSSTKDVRGWEWYYLLSLSKQGQQAILDFTGIASQIAWSPIGDRFFVGMTDRLEIRKRNGQLIRSIHVPELQQFALKADGKQVATVSNDDTLRIWGTKSGKLSQKIKLKNMELCAVAWGKIPNILAVASRPTAASPLGDIIILDRFTRLRLVEHEGNGDVVQFLTVRPQGDALTVAGDGMGATTVFLSNTNKPQVIHGDITCVSWHPSGTKLAVGFESKALSLYGIDPKGGRPDLLFRTDDESTTDSVSFSPDGKQMFVGKRTLGIDVYDVATGRKTTTFKGHLGTVHAMAHHPEEPCLISASDDGSIRVWDEPGDLVVPNQADSLVSEGTSPNGRWQWKLADDVLTVSESRSGATIWELTRVKNHFTKEFNEESGIALFYSGGRENWIQIADLETGECLEQFESFGDYRPFSDHRNQIVVGTYFGNVFAYNCSSKRAYRFRESPQSHVLLGLSPNGDILATACEGDVRLRETAEFEEVARLTGHRVGYSMHSLCWSKDGRYLATAGFDQTAIIWDVRKRRRLHKFYDVDQSKYFQFNADGSRFMAASEFQLKVWSTTTGRELIAFDRDKSSAAILNSFVNNQVSLEPSGPLFAELAKQATVRNEGLSDQDIYQSKYRLLARQYALNTQHTDYAPDQAIELIDRILDESPGEADLIFLKALANYRLARFNEGLQSLDLMPTEEREQCFEFHALRFLCLRRLDRTGVDDSLAEMRRLDAEGVTMPPDLPDLTQQLFHELCGGQDDEKPDEVVVTTLHDGLPDGSATSLRQAISMVATNGTIRFDVRGTIALRFGNLTIDKALAIEGPGVDRLSISGEWKSRILSIDDGDLKKPSVVRLSGLRFIKGKSGETTSEAYNMRPSGGAIRTAEPICVLDCRFEGNIARSGGAVIAEDSQPDSLFQNCVFLNNKAHRGGAIVGRRIGKLHIEDCEFDSNKAVERDGGAILVVSNGEMHLTVADSTFITNTSVSGYIPNVQAGGAIAIEKCQTAIEHCKFIRNKGAAIAAFQNRWRFRRFGETKLLISNSTFSGNQSLQGNPLDVWSAKDVDVKLDDCLLQVANIATNPSNRRISIDPRLAKRVDISADKHPDRPLVVDSLDDENDSDYSSGNLTLREAIVLANKDLAPNVITFDDRLFSAGPQKIRIGESLPVITDSLVISGPGADRLTIDAGGGVDKFVGNLDGYRHFEINDSTAALINVTMSGLTLTSGDEKGSGGAISCVENLTLRRLAIDTNAAKYGGAVRHRQGRLLIDSCTLSNNRAPQNGGAIDNAGQLEMINSTCSGNRAGVNGGALINFGERVTATIQLSTFHNNVAVAFPAGSAIANWQSVTIENSIVSGSIRNLGSISADYSLFGSADPGVRGTSNSFGRDALLGALADNGGPTRTHAPAENSPVIDAGDKALQSRLVTPVSVITNTGDLYPVNNLINRSGLSAITASSYMGVAHAPFDEKNAWVTKSAGAGDYFENSVPPVLEFDLGRAVAISHIVLWGYSKDENPGNSSEAKSLNVSFSTDGGVTYQNGMTLRHAQTGINSETISLGDQFTADHVRVEITDNYHEDDGEPGSQVGLGEVRFLGPLYHDQRGTSFERIQDSRIDVGALESKSNKPAAASPSD